MARKDASQTAEERTSRTPGRGDSGPERRVRARSPGGGFSARRLVATGLLTAVLLAGVLYTFHRVEQFLIRDPRFALDGGDVPAGAEALLITGVSHASRHALERVFAEDSGRSVYLIPLSDRRTTLRTVDWVKDATVARLWPNRVLVRVTERKPVAFVTLRSGSPALIDADGVILPPTQGHFDLPVLDGVQDTGTLSERRERVQLMLRLLSDLGPPGRRISEIDVSDRDNLKVTQPYQGQLVTLLLGDHDFAARYGNFLNHYAEIQRRLPGARTLDLRLEDRITVVE
jgi:cell division septal protein FtsQ